jgi:uncharacterized SAM-binding protein YcdF (DUF218 family)
MYIVNKIVGGCLNPLVIGMMLVVAGGMLLWRGWRKAGFGFLGASVAWFWIWSMPITYRWMGYSLEREWPVVKAEDAPNADAIVLLGGGMGASPTTYPYAEMYTSADRVWHAARLYKAGKAPLVIPSGAGDEKSTLPLLLDFGVPESAIVVENKARNTEENAKFVEKLLTATDNSNPQLPTTNYQLPTKKILLVTSAWHMRRSVLMYRKYAPNLEIIPAATDYEATVNTIHPFCFQDICPDAVMFAVNQVMFKEYLGYWGYRLFR